MKLQNIVLALGFFSASAALAQGPMYDKIIVNLPYEVKVRDTVLPPGEYEIRQDPSPTNNRILRFYTDKGMKFETTAMAIPALDNRTPTETSLMLDKYGSDYYLNKIWVQGKQYGYEIPLPKEARQRRNELMARVTVPATTSGQSTITTTTTETAQVETPAVVEERVEVAEATPQPAIDEPQAVETVPQANEPVVAANPVPVEERPVAEDIPSDLTQTANREMDQNPAPAELPKTAAGWMALVLGGSGLLGAGLKLRRKQ